jgi:hypothetical protein
MRIFAAGVILLCVHPGLMAAAAAPAFPALQVSDLKGAPAGIPAALSGPCLVVVGFSHASSSPSKAWQEHFCAAAVSGEACPVYEVVELESAPFFVPPIVRSGLRKEVPAPLQDHVFIARQGQQALKAALGFDPAAPDDPYLALVTGHGEIAWYGHGPWSQGRQDELANALQLLRRGIKIPLGSAKGP